MLYFILGIQCSQNGRKQECFKILIGSPAENILLGRPRRRMEENGMDLKDVKETGIDTRNRADSAQDREYWRDLGNVILNLWVP